LHNYLVLTRSFFHRDDLCRKRTHQSLMFSRSGRLESRCLLLQIRFLHKVRIGSLNSALKHTVFVKRFFSYATIAKIE
jgi:hypothetical protein